MHWAVIPTGLNCNSTVRVTYSCGGCSIPYPITVGTEVSCRWLMHFHSKHSSKKHQIFDWQAGVPLVLKEFRDHRFDCGCALSDHPTKQIWYFLLDNSNITSQCDYAVSVNLTSVCSMEPTCASRGICTNSVCTCESGRDLLDCSSRQ